MFVGRFNGVEYDTLCDYLTVVAVVAIGVVVVILAKSLTDFITAAAQTVVVENGKRLPEWREVGHHKRGRVKTMTTGRQGDPHHTRTNKLW